MSLKRKLAVPCAAAVLAAGMTGCGTNTAIAATIDGFDVRAGIYLYYLMNDAYSNAMSLLPEDAEISSLYDKGVTIEDKDSKIWVQEEACRLMREYVAIERKYDEFGLTLEQSTLDDNAAWVNYYWSMSDYQKLFEGNGVSKQSVLDIFANSSKRAEIFQYYYGENGPEPLAEDDMKAYYDENYARVKWIAVNLTDEAGNVLEGNDRSEALALAEDYEKRATPENMDELIQEYQDYKDNIARQNAEAVKELNESANSSEESSEVESGSDSAADSSADSSEESSEVESSSDSSADSSEESSEVESNSDSSSDSGDSGDSEEESASSSDDVNNDVPDDTDDETETNTDPYANERTVKKGAASPSEKVNGAIFEKAEIGKVILVEDEKTCYVIMRYDLLEREDLFEGARSTILSDMKGDAFSDIVTAWGEELDMQLNQAAYRRYKPEKMKQTLSQ